MYEILKQTPPVQQLEAASLLNVDTLHEWAGKFTGVPAPSGGAGLPGSTGEVLEQMLQAGGVETPLHYNHKGTGNAILQIGAEKDTPDLILTTHLDRPTFRVKSLSEGTLYPICSIRFPQAVYKTGAVASRFEGGRLITAARGTLIAEGDTFRFEADEGELAWADNITMYEPIQRDGSQIIGSGFDNTIGILALAAAAQVFSAVEADLKTRERSIVFAFTEHEEGPPSGYFFSQGSSRLAHALPQPTIGVINVDGHGGEDNQVALGEGASHGIISSYGRGSVTPPHFAALAEALAREVNAAHPGTVQMNYGYISRSDDMSMHRWSRVIGLVGMPLLHAHTGEEQTNLDDMVKCVRWLTTFMTSVLDFVPELTTAYQLER